MARGYRLCWLFHHRFRDREGYFYSAICDSAENRENVVASPSQALLIAGLRDHEWSQNDDFMAALQNAFPDEEICTEAIE